jgi:hypothetical protein
MPSGTLIAPASAECNRNTVPWNVAEFSLRCYVTHTDRRRQCNRSQPFANSHSIQHYPNRATARFSPSLVLPMRAARLHKNPMGVFDLRARKCSRRAGHPPRKTRRQIGSLGDRPPKCARRGPIRDTETDFNRANTQISRAFQALPRKLWRRLLPNADTTALMPSFTAASFVTSIATAVAWPPAALIS